MQRKRSGLVVPVLAALALASGGVLAPNVAHGQTCVADWPITTITTIGKGQSPTNNPKVSIDITGNIVDPGALRSTAHRIPICTETAVTVLVTDTTGDPTVSQAETKGPISCDDATNTCQVTSLDATAKFIARSSDGKDTDRMTLLPTGEPSTIGSHKCVLDASSEILISTQIFPLPLSISGSTDVTCGLQDLLTGKAPCSCSIQEIDPIPIGAIGLVCIAPGTDPCDPGEIDCDGGNPLDLDVRSDHNVGTCTGQLDCEASCQAHCTGLGLGFVSSGCEGFCTDGAQMPCSTDAACVAAGQGSCSGADPPIHAACGCHCGGIVGSPSRAGGLLCNAPTAIKVVPLTGTCADDPLIDVGEACIALTTETVTNLLEHANNGANELPCFRFDAASCSPGLGGSTVTGIPADCGLLADSVTTGTSLIGAVNFFDSTIGDLAVSIAFNCQ